ncbi:MAG: InlB B-repeat-containing protein [Eubacteriales bacterium]|jgi:hypothetical protein
MKKRLTAFISSLALAAFSALGVTAFEFEKPESADELSAKASQAALAAEAVTDPELGILIYKQTFDTDAAPVYINTDYDIYGINTDLSGLTLADGALTATGTAGSYRQFNFQYKDVSGSGAKFYPRSGTYTTTFDLRNDAASTTDITELLTRYQGTNHYNGFVSCYVNPASANANKGTWQSFKTSHVFTRNSDDTFTAGLADSTSTVTSGAGERIYQLRLYVKGAESVSIDNICLWYFPANAYVLRDGESYAFTYYDSGDFTFGTPESTENFVGWVSTDGKLYAAGTVIAAADVGATVLGKTFTAFYQDASKPAMGMAFEGTNDKNVNFNIGILSGDSNVKETSYVTEDGRTAVRIYCENGGWNPRFHALTETPFDSEEYTLVQYVYKAEQGQNTAGTDITDSSARLLYWTSAETDGFYTDGEHKIGGGDISLAVDNEWKTLTYDMSDAANGLAAHPWNKTGGVYGISASPLRAPALAVSYIDAIRVYRKGVVTVTYDTNAPEGATVTKTVKADTNRGVGTGYYLSSDIPAAEGYHFAGWALEPDASALETVSKIDLTGNTTVYAVWVSEHAPLTSGKTSIRTSGVTGIRFKASVYQKVTTYDEVEIGFLATRSNEETRINMELTGGELNLDCVTYGFAVKGTAFEKTDGNVAVNRLWEDGDGVFSSFTACVIGIPKKYYTENILVRPYVTIGSTTYYGAAKEQSLYNAAKACEDTDNPIVKDILSAGGSNT